MSIGNDIDLAATALRNSIRKLDAVMAECSAAVARYRELVEGEVVESAVGGQIEGARLPKGRVREILRLAFSSGSLRHSSFKQVSAKVATLNGSPVSQATVRQTLYRMREAGELECYTGRWSIGRGLSG